MTKLSKRAEKTLARVKAGKFYRTYNRSVPDSMNELIAAGLVTTAMRVIVVERGYVPTQGYTSYVPEKFE